jgi:hypothetical protein
VEVAEYKLHPVKKKKIKIYSAGSESETRKGIEFFLVRGLPAEGDKNSNGQEIAYLCGTSRFINMFTK